MNIEAARLAVREYLAGEFPDYALGQRADAAEEVFTLDKGDMRHVLRIARTMLEANDPQALRRLLEARKVAERLVEFGAMPVRVSL